MGTWTIGLTSNSISTDYRQKYLNKKHNHNQFYVFANFVMMGVLIMLHYTKKSFQKAHKIKTIIILLLVKIPRPAQSHDSALGIHPKQPVNICARPVIVWWSWCGVCVRLCQQLPYPVRSYMNAVESRRGMMGWGRHQSISF